MEQDLLYLNEFAFKTQILSCMRFSLVVEITNVA